MIDRHLLRQSPAAIALAAACLLYGCEAPRDSAGMRSGAAPAGSTPQQPLHGRSATPASSASGQIVLPLSERGDGQTQPPVSTVIDARPAAMVDGRALTWGELRPTLNDLAGAEALREAILDRKIDATLVQMGIVIGADEVAAERKLLLENLSDDSNTAIRLMEELRARQDMGRRRFDAHLRRNAALRALVRPQVSVTDEAVRAMHDVVHGPKRQARIIVTRDLAQAQAAINLVNSGVSFADAAVDMSDDSSAARGGLLEPISQSDPNYPEALRQTIFALGTGEMSGPVFIGDRYAVAMLVKRLAADGVSIDDARPALERMVRASQERLLMDQLARRLLLDTAITVFDEDLNESWQRAKRQ